MLMRKRTTLALAALALLAVTTALRADRVVPSTSQSTLVVYLPLVVRNAVPPATPTCTRTATPTVTITPTPIPPFPGYVQTLYSHNAVDGWGWPAGQEVTIDVASAVGSHKETLSLVAAADGQLPWTDLSTQVVEGDWITLTCNSLQTGFPIVLLTAEGDPDLDLVEGVARTSAPLSLLIGHGGNWYRLQSQAGPDGRFSFQCGSEVDWDYGDYLRVDQQMNANGRGAVSVEVKPPRTATPTMSLTPTATAAHDGPPYVHIAPPGGTLYAGRAYTLTVAVTDVDNNELID